MYRKGFTLIEVLIVLIIIGILSTLLMPQIGGMVERARTAEAMGILGAIRSALVVYYMEKNPQTFPWTAATNTAAVESALGEVVDNTKTLFDYSWVAPATPTVSIVVRAARNNTNLQGAKKSQIDMTINGDGSASISTTWI